MASIRNFSKMITPLKFIQVAKSAKLDKIAGRFLQNRPECHLNKAEQTEIFCKYLSQKNLASLRVIKSIQGQEHILIISPIKVSSNSE